MKLVLTFSIHFAYSNCLTAIEDLGSTTMNFRNVCSSPTYKNVKMTKASSPVELREKMRKDYKSQVLKKRDLLLNRFRSSAGSDLRSALIDIFNDTLNSKSALSEDYILDNEEIKILEDIKQELIQEELDWWIEEYEKSHNENIDWSMGQNENVICLICQKNNFVMHNDMLSCPPCNIKIKVNNTLGDLKRIIHETIEKHNNLCCKDVQFTNVTESNETHIYYICDTCMDMQLVI